MPMEDFGSDWDELHAEGSAARREKKTAMRRYKFVSPDFFRTAGTRLMAGRELTWDDIYGEHRVVLVSENLAREWWGSPSAALGKRLREYDDLPWYEVVGVVEDTRENGVDKDAPAIVYWPPLMRFLYGQKELDPRRAVTFVMRTQRAGSHSLVRELHDAVWSVEPNLPVSWVRTMQNIYDHSLSRTSFALAMLGTAAAMALVLGIIGIYGVISYAVSQRRREIGIRLALGAQTRELKNMFVRSGVRLAAVGLVIGLVAALALSRFMNSLLFGVNSMDPVTYIAVPIVLIAAAVLASYLPARRATRVDPAETLRAE
jgi:predicted permease